MKSGEREKKKAKINDGEQHVQTSNDTTRSDVPAPGDRYDSGEKPSALSNKNFPAPSSDEGERNASGEKLTMQEPTALHKEERNDSGETNVQEPKVFLNKNFSERYKKLKRLHPAPQKPVDMWLLDCAIMNQTTEGREKESPSSSWTLTVVWCA